MSKSGSTLKSEKQNHNQSQISLGTLEDTPCCEELLGEIEVRWPVWIIHDSTCQRYFYFSTTPTSTIH